MINVKDLYKKYFYISPIDLADFAEKNRIRNYYLSVVALIAIILTIPVLFVLYHNNLRENLASFVFFAICLVVNILSVFLCNIFKDVKREKAYILKNIPLYTVFCWGMIASVYNFYIQKSSFLGVLTFFNAVLIVLSVFFLSIPLFSTYVLAGLFGMAPGIYKYEGLTGVLYFSLITILMIALAFFLRYRDKQIIMALKRQKKSLEIKTFGNFTAMYDKKVIKFTRSKSLELLAYLIYKNGTSVNTKELLSVLYGDHADSAHYGASLRLLISDIKHSLSELEIQNFFITEYNNFRINPEVVQCDYYNFLAGDQTAIKSFSGEFMSQFSWAEDASAFLERKISLVN